MFTGMIRAGRVLECGRVNISDTASEAPMSIFIAPVAATLTVGDVVTIEGTLAYSGNSALVPVVLGDWSPAIFDRITDVKDVNGNSISDTDYLLFAAHIKID